MNNQKIRYVINTFQHFKYYLGTDVIVASLGLLLIPVLTRLLTVGEYGILNVFFSYINIFTIVFFLNSHASIGRYYYEGMTDFNEFVSSTILFSATIFIPVLYITFLFRNQLSLLLGIPLNLLFVLPFLSVFGALESIYRQIYQARLESKKIAVTLTIKAVLLFILSIIITYILKHDVYWGPIFGRLIAGCVFFIYFIGALRPFYRPALNKAHIYYILNYSVPLIPYALSSVILAQFDRIMVNIYQGSESAGLYSFAYNVGMILSLIIGALNSAFYPKFFRYLSEGDCENHDFEIVEMQKLIVLASIVLIIFCKEIGFILAPANYSDALRVVPLVIIGYNFYLVFTIYNRNIDYYKKTIYSSMVLLTAGVCNIVLNIYFIARYGYIAAAYTTLTSYFFLAVLSWFVSKFILKAHSIHYSKITRPMLYFIPCILFLNWLGADHFHLSMFAQVLMKLAFVCFISLIIFSNYIRYLFIR